VPTPYIYVEDDALLADLADALYQAVDLQLAIDTETTGLDPQEEDARLLLLQIGLPEECPGTSTALTLSAGAVYVINACKCDLSIIKPVLEDGRLLIIQNAKFDLKWLRVHAGIRPRRVFCTMLAELMIAAGFYDDLRIRRQQASLKALVKRYLNREMDKHAQKHFINWKGDEFPAYMLQYAADDVPLLFEIMTKQHLEINKAGIYDIAKLEFDALAPVVQMELNGLGINPNAYRAVTLNARAEMAGAEATVRSVLAENGAQKDLWGDVSTNLSSNAQLLREFKRMGIELTSTDETSLNEVIILHRETRASRFAEALLTYRGYQKLVGTYGDKVMAFVHPVTGRIHAEYQQLGSDAGRFSCDSPNIQQIPRTKNYRSCFVPLRGNVLVVGDWSQFELRILCAFSGDEGMLRAFNEGRDLHSDTASRMYGIPYEEVTKDHPARQDAKVLNFALAYGMGPMSLAISLKCSTGEAKAKIGRYFEAYPGVKVYLESAARAAVTNGETRTLMGRRRQLPPPMGTGRDYRAAVSAMERKGKNTPIQGSNADFLKLTMARVHDRLWDLGVGQELGTGIVACVHDEIVLEVPRSVGEQARDLLEQEMVETPKPWMRGVPIKADVGIADCWLK
jgi:DNA polymerase-1